MIVIASSSSDYLSSWKQALFGLDTVVQVSDLPNLRRNVEKFAPRFLLLDLDFPGLGGAPTIRKLRKASPTTKIIVLGVPASEDVEVDLFLAGVRGCCPADGQPDFIRRVVNVVGQGEPWIRRAVMPRLLDRLVGRSGSGSLEALRQVSQVISTSQQKAAAAESEAQAQSAPVEATAREKASKPSWGEAFRKVGLGERLKMALMMGSTQES